MSEGETRLTPRSVFGYVLFFVGLALLGYVSFNAICLASGLFTPLRIGQDTLTIENQMAFGILLQIGMYVLLIVIASVLMSSGLSLSRRE